jgi:chloride channel protein, CIC family
MQYLARSLRTLVAAIGRRLTSVFDLEISGELVVLSAAVGAAAGLVAFLFVKGLTFASRILQQGVMHYSPPGAGVHAAGATVELDVVWWAVLLLPTIGGLLSGFLVFTFAPEAEGHGSDAMVRSFHRLRGKIRGRVPFIKGVASILTIATGGSAGREGPIAQVGAGVGAGLADLLHLSDDQRRYLMLAGAAGGISAVFQSPLGAALFVCEVLYSSAALETSALLFSTISAVSAYTVFTALHGAGHEIIAAQALKFHGFAELPFYAIFSVLCAIVGYVYVKAFYGLRDHFFHKLPIPRAFKPAIGGLLLGVLVLAVRIPGGFDTGLPHVLAGGYGWIQQALDGDLDVWWMLAILAIAKIVATSLTISSGGSGGVFAPSLYIGAMLGGAYGIVCHYFFPEQVPQPEVFVLVGMGGFFAGVAKVPLTAVVMVSEMTGSFGLLVPLMFVSVLTSALLSRRVSLYEEQVGSLIDSPAHQGDFLIDVLANLRVRQVFDAKRQAVTIPESAPLTEIIRTLSQADSNYFPVVDAKGHLVGIFSLSDLRGVLAGHASGSLVRAADIATTPVLTVNPDDDLHTALQRFTIKNIDEIPIVAETEPHRLLGMLRRKDLIAAYHDEIERLKSPAPETVA